MWTRRGPNVDIDDQGRTTCRSTGISTKTQRPVPLEPVTATEAKKGEPLQTPAQESEQLQGKNTPKYITDLAWPRQELSVISDKEDVIMDEIDANTVQLDGERTQEEIKTSPKRTEKMRYDTSGAQAHEWTRSMTRCGTHKDGKV